MEVLDTYIKGITGTAIAFLSALSFSLDRSFSSAIISPVLPICFSICILPVVNAFPTRPRLDFILIESGAKELGPTIDAVLAG